MLKGMQQVNEWLSQLTDLAKTLVVIGIIVGILFDDYFGVIAGFVQGLLSSSYLYDGLILEAETQKLIAEYDAVSFVIIISLSTSFLGILNSLNVKKFLDSGRFGDQK